MPHPRAEYNRQYRLLHPEKLKEWNRRNYLRNSHKHLLTRKRWRAKNSDKLKAYMRDYHKRNYPLKRDRLLLQTKRYAQSHPEVRRKIHLNYVRNHPEQHKSQQRAAAIRRKARLRGARQSDPHINALIRRWKSERSFVCYFCSERFPTSQLEVDHIIAISAGGKHTVDNVCRSCPQCNNRKRHHPVANLQFLTQPVLNL